MAEQSRPGMGQHLGTFWEDIVKSIPLSNGFAALLMTGLQEVFNEITECPCSFGKEFGLLTLLGPIVILVVSLLTLTYEALIDCCGHGKCMRLARNFALTFVASVAWLSMALLNSEALCCIQGGYPSDSPCLVGRNATNNVVLYEKCISDSQLYGVRLMTYGGAISSIVLKIVQAKCGHLNSVQDPNVPLQSVGQ
ncbi:uncharacterized protein LOC144735433 [Lampetra planeri]